MLSPFAAVGARLRENNISVIPIIAGGKAPGTMIGGRWLPAYDWQKFCTRLPTKYELQIWERWPDAGVGVALGSASAPEGWLLVAADIDSEDPAIVAAMKTVLPPSPVRKCGRKGETLFYKATPAVTNRSYNVGKQRVFDLLAHGRQTILPGSIHPSGIAYRWMTPDTLENFNVADLPQLPDDTGDRLAEALAPFGYEPPPVLGTPGAAVDGESVHRSLNETALANLDAWVPALRLHGCRKQGANYKAVAHWRLSSSGRDISKRASNLAISPQGIKDCGEQKGYTPLDLVMAACGADLDVAFGWLQDHVAPSNVVELNLSRPKAAPQPPPGEPAPAEPPPAQVSKPSAIIPDDLCTPPGLLGEVVEWIVASADTPSPQLALGAAITMLGALMGRRFASSRKKEARTNFYSVGIAVTGYGKSHAPACCDRLMRAAGLQRYIGPQDVKSDSALRKLLEAKPSVSLFMDEFGGYMAKILDSRAATHDRRMREFLLAIFSLAAGIYTGSEGAVERAVEIINPNLCIHGTSTPGDFWKAFTSSSADDGLLPRFLVFQVPSGRPEIVDPLVESRDPPRALVQAIMRLMDARPPGNLNGIAGQDVKPIYPEWAEGASEWVLKLRNDLSKEGEVVGGMRQIVLTRVAEHVVKLALVYAVGCDPMRPRITVAALQWAREVVDASSEALLQALDGRVADTDRQREYLKVLRLVREAGEFGILEQALLKIIRGEFDGRRCDDIINQLQAAGEIERGLMPGPAGGRPGQRLKAKFNMAGAA